jgi:hypothetical protein
LRLVRVCDFWCQLRPRVRILAPGAGGARRSRYPSYKTRIKVISDIAMSEGETLPDDASLGFSNELETSNPQERFLIRMAEDSVAEVTQGLWTSISTIIKKNKIQRPNGSFSLRHLKDFKNRIPAHDPACLGDIINAGWKYYSELQELRLSPDEVAEKADHLNEMMLKSLEVLEFTRRTVMP